MATIEEPMLSRLDRLDYIIKLLEDIRGVSHQHSPKSPSIASTPSTGTLTSDGQPSSATDFSPKSLGKRCRPIEDVITETEMKGTLIERLMHVEDRVLKLYSQLEEELQAERNKEKISPEEKKPHKKGIKQLLKSYVKGEGKGKSKRRSKNQDPKT